MPKLTVILPTYNEKENLPLMAEALFSLPIPNLNLLVVDDNSPDGTGQLADNLVKSYDGRMSVYHRTEKNGLGPAYRAGFKQAIQDGADYMLQMDADFSHQPKYIAQMIHALETENADIVLGSRYVKGGSVDPSWSIYRKALSWWANRVYVPTILNVPIYDATGGFRLWRKETIIGLGLDRIESNGYVFQVEMAYVSHRLGYKTVEVPIHFPDRELGESKMDGRIAREAAWRTWSLRRKHHHLTPDDRATSL